jgi:menaquinone-dependent protoporphyrinogen IX oxidase
MGKTIVIYSSKYGYTKKYSAMIAEKLNADLYDIKHFDKKIIKNYDSIIIGSGLYAGKIQGLNLIVENYGVKHFSKIIFFTVGLADYSKENNVNSIRKRIEQILPVNILKEIKIFYLRGGINYKELTLKHKIMMGLLKMIVEKSKETTDEENKLFLETYGQTLSFIEENNINGIIEYYNKKG